jgi:hypothetical protein
MFDDEQTGCARATNVAHAVPFARMTMDMNTLCAACNDGPSGIEGHAALRVDAIGNNVLTFRCASCEAHWSRTSRRSGQFVWTALAARTAGSPWMGVIVPPSAKTAQPS